ncbi:TIGR00374 family protein [Halobacteriales archaeon QH_10_70_21]|nr:MAG: TIGR00374 family protein [Halobacteriales archaeon QH_10_70_21]
MPPDRRATIAGFLGATVVLGVLAYLVGFEDLLRSLSMARTTVAAGVLLVAALWMTAWALALRTVLGALGAGISRVRATAVYAGVLFANNVTPFGQAGGEPISALLISEAAGTEYETALAAIASADSLNFVPSTAIGLVGVTYLSVTVAAGGRLRWATAAVVALSVALPVLGYLGWRYRERLEAAVVGVVAPLARFVGRHLPRLEAPTRAAVQNRVDGFFEAIEVVGSDRRTLLAAAGFSTLGWLAQAVALWLALYAVGEVAPVAAVLVAVPVGAIAGVTPLPGGLGGVEAVLVALLVPLAGVSAATAAAAVVLHRGGIYWLPTLLGGGVVSALGVNRV